MNSFTFWYRWLLSLAILIIFFGLGMALFSLTPLFEPIHALVNPVFWGSEVPAEARLFMGWIYGVLGATMAGWGIILVYLIRYPFKNREAWAWKCILVGITAWFAVDSLISLFYGVFFNASFNTVLLILAYAPLAATRRAFTA